MFQSDDPEASFRAGVPSPSSPVHLPLLSDPTLIPHLHKELGPTSSRAWADPALHSLAQLAWSMGVASLRGVAHAQLGGAAVREAAQAVVDDDEAIMDLALANKVKKMKSRFYFCDR